MEPTNKNFFQRHTGWIIVIAIIVLLVGWAVSSYNGFVRQNAQIDAQWAQVETQYQRRFDLIPNIVATVKGAAKQEQAVFGEIAEARTRYAGATTVDQKAQAASQVEGALGRLLVIAENYPQLQSEQAYRDLIVSLEGTENRVSVERMKYNTEVKVYNQQVGVFPSSILASVFGFKPHAYFEAAAGAETAPSVNFE
ncbi:MAG: LemA family protein [Patescibacteria group bacterium]